jgi:hypothetical protein
MIANALNGTESLTILVKITALGILIDSLAYEAVKGGYINKEIRD